MNPSLVAFVLAGASCAQPAPWSSACPNGQCSAGVNFSLGIGAGRAAPQFQPSYYGSYAQPQFQPSYYGSYAQPSFQSSYYGGYSTQQFQPSYYGNYPIVRDSYSAPSFAPSASPGVIVVVPGGLLRRPQVFVLR